jgi:hypothetical protein
MKFKFLIALVLFATACTKNYPPTSIDKIRVSWTDDPATTFTIGWDENSGKNPVVYYGAKDNGRKWESYNKMQKTTRKIDHLGMNTHFCDLKGLQPNTAYYFVIKDDSGVTDRFWVKTAPDEPIPFTCIFGGDTKSTGEALIAGQFTNKMVAKLRPLFVLFCGDFTNEGINSKQWKKWLANWSEQTRTDDGRLFPIVPINGNHETRDMEVLSKVFNAPYQNNNPTDIYFSLSVGGNLMNISVLNSMVDPGGVQKEWLEKDLKEHKNATFKIAAYHKPFHPHHSKKHEFVNQYNQWAYLFYQYGIDISLDADSHMSKITYPLKPDSINGFEGFVRDDKNGTMFIGEGSWGATPRADDDIKPWTLRHGSFNQFKWLQVFPETKTAAAHIDIRTVITSTRDTLDKAISHVEEVTPLTEKNLFEVPKGIKLFSTEPYGDVITYPFIDKKH